MWADIQLLWMSANHRKAAVSENWAKLSANDPMRTFATSTLNQDVIVGKCIWALDRHQLNQGGSPILATIGEIIDAVTVVLSLIYLAIQLRQNTQAQRTENYSRALDRLVAMRSSMRQDDKFSPRRWQLTSIGPIKDAGHCNSCVLGAFECYRVVDGQPGGENYRSSP